jgi:hypothetical protein
VNRRMCRMHVLLALLVWMIPSPAAAQAPAQAPAGASAAAAAEPLPRWDTTGFFGWRGTRRIEPTDYNPSRWDSRFVYGGAAGYYWTPNLKLEAEFEATAPSTYDTYASHQVPGAAYPFFIRSEHRATTASLGGSVIYQFFENVSFHPFVGGGARWMAIRERITTARQTQVISRGPNGPYDVVVISEEQSRQRDDSEALGQIIAGFKAYPGERVFFRSDVRWAVGAKRLHDLTWRLGVGVDF